MHPTVVRSEGSGSLGYLNSILKQPSATWLFEEALYKRRLYWGKGEGTPNAIKMLYPSPEPLTPERSWLCLSAVHFAALDALGMLLRAALWEYCAEVLEEKNLPAVIAWCR